MVTFLRVVTSYFFAVLIDKHNLLHYSIFIVESVHRTLPEPSYTGHLDISEVIQTQGVGDKDIEGGGARQTFAP